MIPVSANVGARDEPHPAAHAACIANATGRRRLVRSRMATGIIGLIPPCDLWLPVRCAYIKLSQRGGAITQDAMLCG